MIKRNILILFIAILGFSNNVELFAQDESSREHLLHQYLATDEPDETITPQILMQVVKYTHQILGIIPTYTLSYMTMEEIVQNIDRTLELTPEVSEHNVPFVGLTYYYHYDSVERLYILDHKVESASFSNSADNNLITWTYFLEFDDKEEVRSFLRLLMESFIAMGNDPTIGRHLSFTTQPRAADEGYVQTVNCAYSDLKAGTHMAIITVRLLKDN